jgi:hypothetical protein
MVSDPYADATALAAMLKARHLPDWATKLEDVIAAGATSTEILMGIRWVLQELLAYTQLDATVQEAATELVARVNALLALVG